MTRHHLLRAALCLVLLISPVGAPAIGLAMMAICPSGPVFADGPFAMDFARCGLPVPIEDLYQSSVSLPIVLMAKAGTFVGGMLVLLWLVAIVAVLVMLGQHLYRAAAGMTEN